MSRKETNSKVPRQVSKDNMIRLPGNIRITTEKLILTAILLFTLLIYSASLSNHFLVGWDDGEYLADPVVNNDGPINTRAIFSNFYLGMYQPLAVLSFAINHKFSGETTWPYILSNILLHLLNTLLVYKLMKRWMKGMIPALIVTFLFALHPMHVEAVAWISTRSSGLYSLFFLAGLLTWDNYLEKGRQAKYYLLTLLFVMLSLLSKSMAATFPLLMLMMDYLKQRKPGWILLIEKIPFLVLSLIFGIVAIKAAASFGHITVMEEDFTLLQRFFLILYGIAFYIVKMFLPVNLSAIYAFPETSGNNLPAYVYLTTLVPVLAIIGIWKSGKYRREFIGSALFFLFSISMVLPLFWSRIFITADRYSYIPFIGLFMIVARLLTALYETRATFDKITFRMLTVSALLFIFLMSVATFNRIKVWKDTPTLLTDVIEKKRSDADMAHGYFYLGNYYDARNNEDDAMKFYDLALSRNNRYLLALNNRGILKGKAGNVQSAISDFEEALKIKPDYAEAWYNRGVALYQTGNHDKACDDWNKAMQLNFKPAGDALRQNCGN